MIATRMAALLSSALALLPSAFLEGLGVPWPAEVLLTTAGTQYDTLFSVFVMGTAFSAAYTCGAIIQYLLGRSFSHLVDRLVRPQSRQKLDATFERYGQAAVLWTRPLPGFGNLMSIPAGIMRMPMGRFVLYTFVGIWPWAAGLVWAGSVLGQYMGWFETLAPYIAGVAVLVAVVSAVRGYYHSKKESEPRK